MGNNQGKPVVLTDAVNLNHFRLLRVVGKGAFGKVRIVERKDTGEAFALKYIRKDEVVRSESVRNIIRERRMLEHLNHPFLCNLRYSFQDIEYLYLVQDLMNGGDLRFHITRKTMTEDAVRFWMAELACALRYIHKQGIVHRDLKPDNVLLDSEGHVHLADFNVASDFRKDKKLHSKSGTLAYLAPEVYGGHGYLSEVDWWSLGVTFYECIYNKRPFESHHHDKLEKEISAANPKYPITQPPVSMPCVRAISSLLEKDTRKRIGAAGFSTFAEHPFFAVLDFTLLEQKRIPPIFVPSSDKTNFDATYDLEELLLEEAPLEARARRQKPRAGLKENATEKEIRDDELHRMIEKYFEPFDYTQASFDAASLAKIEKPALLEENGQQQAQQPATSNGVGLEVVPTRSRSPKGSPPMTALPDQQQGAQLSPQNSSQSAHRSRRDHHSPSPGPERMGRGAEPVGAPVGPAQAGMSASKGGGMQRVLGETGSWSDLQDKSPTMPADGAQGLKKGEKPSGVLGFLGRRSGRARSPKPREPGVLGKEGARVVINSGR